MTEAVSTKSDYQRLSPKEFFNVSLWVVKFVFNISPTFTTVHIATRVLERLTDIANTLILAKLIDALVQSIQTKNNDLTQMYNFILILLAFNIVQVLINIVSSWAGTGLRIGGRPKIRRAFYSKLNSLGIQTLEQPYVSDKIFRADQYLMNVVGYLEDTVIIISDFVRAITMLAIIATFLPLFIPIIIISTIPGFIYDKRGRSKLYKHINESTEGQRKSNQNENALTSTKDLQEVTLTQGFGYLDNKFWDFQKSYTDRWRKIALDWRTGSYLYSLLSDSIVLYCVYRVFLEAFNQVISVGDTLYRFRFLNQFQSSIMNIFKAINDLSEQAIRMSDVYQVFKMVPIFDDGTLPMGKLTNGPDITLDKLSFKYPNSETYVLKGLDLKIKSGEKIAIVGQNGAGKTTLVKLICKLYDLTDGDIIVNNRSLKDINIKDWHRNIGILFQDYNIYPQLTVRENIIMGNPEAPVDEIAIRLAAEQADASEFINKYKNGYDQILGEKYKGGVRPSTGQWQKLAIARFFYRNAPLVIFDEPTAAIDAVSEYNIFNRIYEFFKGKTVIIISHRFSTVRNADRILVIDEGKILEEGSHEQLMAKNGKYAEAFLLQAKGYVESIAS